MKYLQYIILAALPFTAIPVNQVAAQTKTSSISSSSVQFLHITPDARAAGMGNAALATKANAYAALHNLAGIQFADSASAVGVTYTPWLRDAGSGMYLATVSGYHQLNNHQAIAASMRYFKSGAINLTDESGNSLGAAHPQEYALDLGYALQLSRNLSLGVALRYIHSRLATGNFNGLTYKAGNAVAADLSLYHNGLNEKGEGWNWGVVLANLGSRISYTSNGGFKDFIPASLGAGASYTKLLDEQNSITFALDMIKPLVPSIPTDAASVADYYNKSTVSSWFASFQSSKGGFKNLEYNLGAEYLYNQLLFVRAGCHYVTQSNIDERYFTAGVGLRYHVADIALSYVAPSGSGITRNAMSNTVRFSAAFNLAKK